MTRLNNTDGFILHGWMVNELALRGGHLFAFALVHQFSQSNAGVYKGGVPYLAAWLGCSGNTARKYLRDLEDRGLVKSERGTIGGVPFCYYRVHPDTLKKFEGTPKNLEGNPQNIEVPTPKKFEVENNNRKIKGDNTTSHRVFVKPTVDEVREYCTQRNNGIDPEEFVAFYESKGWRVGTAPMKDWRAAIITWEKKRRQSRPATSTRKPAPSGDYYSNLMHEIKSTYGTVHPYDEQ